MFWLHYTVNLKDGLFYYFLRATHDKNSIFLTELGERVFTDAANSVPGSERFYLSFLKALNLLSSLKAFKKKIT